MTSLYSGQMDSGNNGLRSQEWRLTWGDALNDIPGSDEERAQRAGLPAGAQMNPQAQQNLEMLQLLFSLFASGGSSDSSDRTEKRPSVGCAPGNINPACYH